MPHNLPASVKAFIKIFCAGFVLGVAFMASPAIGIVLGLVACAYVLAGLARPSRSSK